MIKTSLKPKTNTLKLKISEGNPLKSKDSRYEHLLQSNEKNIED